MYLAGVLTGVAIATLPVALGAVGRAPARFDGATPALRVQPVRFVLGDTIDAAQDADPADGCTATVSNRDIPLRMRWSAHDATRLDGYQVWVTNPDYGTNFRTDTTATSRDLVGENYAGDCSPGSGRLTHNFYWVAVRDERGNAAASAMVLPWMDVWRETGEGKWGDPQLPVTRRGAWSTGTCSCANHGQTLYSRRAGASLTYTVTSDRPGRVVALVAAEGTDHGVMRVRVDGGSPASVDTYAPTAASRVIVWQRVLTPGSHRIRVTNAGTPGRTRVEIDAIMLGPAFSEPAPVFPTPTG